MASAGMCSIMLPKLLQMLLSNICITNISNMQNRQNKKRKKSHMTNKDRRFLVLAATRDTLDSHTFAHFCISGLSTFCFSYHWVGFSTVSQDPFNGLPSPTAPTNHLFNSTEVLRGLLGHQSWHTYESMWILSCISSSTGCQPFAR